MPYYLLPLRNHVAEPRSSAFRYRQCEACGAHQREQLADLKVTVIEPFEAFTTTGDGDWIARDDIAAAVRRVEPSVAVRHASVKGTPGSWSQLVPTKCIELASTSLRSPREHCSRCGGVARVQFADYPPLVIPRDPEELSQVAFICGARKMIVFSPAVLTILKSAVPGFTATRVLLEGEVAPPETEG